MSWTVYILQCADMSLYTGITLNMAERLAQHANGTGAKYTRGRGPHVVLYTEQHETKGAALRREAEIKRLRRTQKMELGSSLRQKTD